MPGQFFYIHGISSHDYLYANEDCFMKCLPIVLFLFLVLVNIHGIGHAEYVFKKDGSIIKGSIVADEIATISLKKEAGGVERINRQDIMRIVYTDLYMGKVYARLTSGEVAEGYQVDEDRDNYFFRKDINKPAEFTLSRKKVMFIARTNPTDLKGTASTEFINVAWSPPFKPAKSYKIYIRDVKEKEEKFKVAGETDELVYKLKNLHKSWSYEVYATAVSDTGEESLPSEKIIVNTLPDFPENLMLTEILSEDKQRVTLTFGWTDVADPLSRVKSYSIYEIVDGERKKRGTSKGGEFVIRDYPAEGRHWFSLVAVNDLGTESDEVKTVYDAGFKLYIRGLGSYVYPMGVMRKMAASGYGGLIDLGLSTKNLSLGLETGVYTYNCTEDINSMLMFPVLIEFNYRMPLFWHFLFRPVIKAGGSYDMIKYVVHDVTNPLITSTTTSKGFDPMVSAGGYLQFEILDRISIFGGTEFSTIFQKSGRMSFLNGSFGAEIIF
jgi:hypothetical protein